MTPNNPLGLLGKLPRELRDMIYANAVDPPTKDDFAGEADDYYRDITRRRPIMQTCKQVRLECVESYLSENEIECDIGPPCWYGLFTSLSNILARPYFRAQGYSMYVECFRQSPFDMETTQQCCQTMQTYLRLYRSIPQIGFSIQTKSEFSKLVEAIKSTPKRNMQETEGMVETQERSPKRRDFD